MHQQIRVSPTQSAANVEAVFLVLEQAGIDILAVGGSDIETGGELGIGVADADEKKAFDALQANGYYPRWAKVHTCYLSAHQVGALRGCLHEANANNEGRSVQDIAIGVPPKGTQLIPVQIYFKE